MSKVRKKLTLLTIFIVLTINLLACGEIESANVDLTSKVYTVEEDTVNKENNTEQVTTVQQNETDKISSKSNNILDGVSDQYVMLPVQAPTDLIINEYHEKGYQHVWLTSHTVSKSDEEGAIDEIHLQVQYNDPNGLYEIKEEISALYVYWGPAIGWRNNYDLGELSDYDITGFNHTYWKFNESSYDNYREYEIAKELVGKDIINQYDADSSVIDIYMTFHNFDVFKARIDEPLYFEKVTFFEDTFDKSDIGTAVIVINDDMYSCPLKLANASGGSYHSKMLVAEGAEFYFKDADSMYNCCISYSIDDRNVGIRMISEKEYEQAIRGNVINVSESEKNEIEGSEEKLSDQDIDYSVIYSKVFDEIDDSMEYGSYCLWDLDKNGILELIIGHGEYSADYINDVWTIDDSGTLLKAGEFYGEQVYCEAPDGNGIYTVYGHMGHEEITRITIVNGKIAEETIRDRELSSEEEDYYDDKEIYCMGIDDRSLLE